MKKEGIKKDLAERPLHQVRTARITTIRLAFYAFYYTPYKDKKQ